MATLGGEERRPGGLRNDGPASQRSGGMRWRDLRHIRVSWGGRRMPAKDGLCHDTRYIAQGGMDDRGGGDGCDGPGGPGGGGAGDGGYCGDLAGNDECGPGDSDYCEGFQSGRGGGGQRRLEGGALQHRYEWRGGTRGQFRYA